MLHTASAESCFSVASPSFSPSRPMIATTSNRDCDEGWAGGREGGREGGRKEGRKEGRRAREGERRRARSGGAILPFPFSDKRSFMPPEPLLLRRCRSSERERAKEGERKDGETYVRTYSLTAAFDRRRGPRYAKETRGRIHTNTKFLPGRRHWRRRRRRQLMYADEQTNERTTAGTKKNNDILTLFAHCRR